jgi:hypothetical protein
LLIKLKILENNFKKNKLLCSPDFSAFLIFLFNADLFTKNCFVEDFSVAPIKKSYANQLFAFPVQF